MIAGDSGLPGRSARHAEFEAEALRQLDALHTFGFRLTRGSEEADLLVADTFARASELWDPYRLGTNIRAWLFTILYDLFVGRGRRTGLRPADVAGDPGGCAETPPTDESELDSPAGSFTEEEVSLAIDALPDDCRAAVLLRDLHGLAYAEVAQVLGVPERTAKSRLLRGRRILQRALAK